MNYFIFNNQNSKDFDIIIEKMPVITKAAKRVDQITIPGRNGKLNQDEGTYDTSIIQIQCALLEHKRLDEIKAWLNGFGNLILSNYKDRFFKASIINQIDYTDIANAIDEFPLEIELDPFSYSLEQYKKIYTEGSEHILNIPDATAEMEPMIKVFGNGNITLMINNSSMLLNIDEYIELDCESLIAHKNYVPADDRVKGNFYKLYPGKNTINLLGNYTKLEILYRKAYL